MAQEKPSGRDALVETLRGGASSIRSALSQLKTRRKGADAPPSGAPKPVPEGPRWGQLVLIEKVGEGAFGEVYRAWDTTLEREVALKLMRAADEDPVLLQEARMLARLRHSNVVAVYGVDRHDGRSGVWMDFIEGQTLAAIVKELGALGALEALLVGVDVCRALAAVHQSGLLHRDVKAQNVMRERGGRIVLMDFGLGHEATDSTRDFGGTPLYMAPELLDGQPATARTDIYAAGVLLFHLTTKSYPVVGSTIEELRAAHASGEIELLQDLRPDLPSEFVQAVEKAIAREPSRRYATVGQMTAALETALGQRRPPLISRRAFWWTATPLAALGAGAAWYKWGRPATSVTPGGSLFLTEISNATGDGQLDALTEVLRNQLAQSAYFNLLEADRVQETLRMMTRPSAGKLELPVSREVALRSKTPLLVYGTVSPLGAGFGLSLVMERIEGQPRTPRASDSKLFDARSKSGLFDAIHQAANWVRQTAGEAAKDISDKDAQPEEATTSSWEALDYFTRGERLHEQRRWLAAVSMYQQAVRSDAGFALALARIAQEQGILGLSQESFDYWRKAVDALQARRVTRREDLRIRGLYASLTEDFGGAEALMHTFTLLYPNDFRAHHYRALALRELGRLEDARAEFLAAQGIRPSDATLVNMTTISLRLGRQTDVAAYLKDLPTATAGYYGGLAKFLAHDFAGAEAALENVLQKDDPRMRSAAFGAKACLLAELGRVGEASAILERGIASDAEAGNQPGRAKKLCCLAQLHLLGGQRETARTLALEAAHADTDTQTLLRAGSLLARAGFSRDARGILSQMNAPAEGRRFETAQTILTGEIALAEGRTDDAIARFTQADRLAPPVRPRDFLARAWDRLGRSEDALAAWRRISAWPALVWVPTPDSYDPGVWTGSLLRLAELSASAGRVAEARTALDQFLKIREHADAASPDLTAARKLLKRL